MAVSTNEVLSNEVQQPKTVDCGKQLDDVIRIINEITKDATNVHAKEQGAKFAEKFKKDEKFSKAFTEYLINNPHQLEKLRAALGQSIQRLVEKIKGDNGGQIPDEIKPLLNLLENKLGISLGNEHYYQVVQNSVEIATKAGLTGATFYSAELGTSTAGNGSERPSVSENGGEKEYIVKLNNNPDNFYNVKVDKEGNLCPLAEEISNKLVNKKGEAIKSQVLLSNNESCKKYLANKLPDEIKSNCVIGWDSRLNDYTLTSYGRTLTIEPMTIAGDWISKDLSRNLAFLNLTNYIRKFGDQYGKIDPDVNKKLKIKGTKVDKEKVYIKKEEFGLKEAQDEEISRFKKYNNHEQWEDNWDKKKNNTDYRKIIFPTLQAKPAGSATSGRSELGAAGGSKSENNPTGSSERASSSSGSGATETSTGRSETSTGKPEAPVETGKLVEISSDLRGMSDDDFEAMKKLLGDDMFIEKKDGKVSYNLEKTKAFIHYRISVVEKRKDLKTNTAYLSAVQILLNDRFNANITINGQYKVNGEMYKAVKGFQKKYNELFYVDGKYQVGFEPLAEDGIPGCNTFNALCGYVSYDLTSITDKQAECLSNVYSIIFDKLTSITDKQAESLSKVEYLRLDGLISITDKQAESLSKVETLLSLNGLTSITDKQAENLSKAERLSLDGLTSITDKQAESLSKVKDLSLGGLTSITDKQAESLSKVEALTLDGLTSITDKQAESLSNVKYLHLNGLTSITDKQAESLSKVETFFIDKSILTEKQKKILEKHISY